MQIHRAQHRPPTPYYGERRLEIHVSLCGYDVHRNRDFGIIAISGLGLRPKILDAALITYSSNLACDGQNQRVEIERLNF